MENTLYDILKDDEKINLRTGNYRLINKGKYEDIGIFLDLTTRCNKNCEFCSYKKIPGCDISDEILEQVYLYFEKIFNFYTGEVKIILFGGEPTIYSGNCETVIDRIYNINHSCEKVKIELQSNFSQNVGYYVKLLNKLTHLTLTWHIDQQNDVFLQKFSELASLSKENKNKIEVFVMFSNYSYQNSYKYKLELEKLGIYSELHFIKMDDNEIDPIAEAIWKKDSEKYIKENILLINDHIYGYEEWFNKVFPFDMPEINCYSGYQQQYIDIYGNIYRCDTKHINGESFGNVETIKLPFDLDLKCEKENCHRDWHVRKELKKK